MTRAIACTTALLSLLAASSLPGVASSGIYTKQPAKLIGSGAAGRAQQGTSVAVSDDGLTLALGGVADRAYLGAVWVFVRSADGTWTQQGSKLVGSDADGPAQQGGSVALSADGNVLASGGSFDASYKGAVWVFTRSAGGTWAQAGLKLVGSDAVGKARQGFSVALTADGAQLASGGWFDRSGIGAVWLFARAANGTWAQSGLKIVGSGADGAATQGFSVALSADGGTLLSGGPSDRKGSGAVWAFARAPGGVWYQSGPKLVGATSLVLAKAHQGRSVSVSANGRTAAFGCYDEDSKTGFVWAFVRSADGTWAQQGPALLGSGAVGPPSHGRAALSADGSVLASGSERDDSQRGAVWLFARSADGAWRQRGLKLSGVGAVGPARFSAAALSADGGLAVVGGRDDSAGTGAVWVYEYCAACEEAGSDRLSVGAIVGIACGGAALLALAACCCVFVVARRPKRARLEPDAAKQTAAAEQLPLSELGSVHVNVSDSENGRSSHCKTFGGTVVAQAGSALTYLDTHNKQTAWTTAERTLLTQREAGDCKAGCIERLQAQLEILYRQQTLLLDRFCLLSSEHQRVGGQGLVQFAVDAFSEQQFAFKFFLDEAAFATELQHYSNAGLRHVLPPVHEVFGNERGCVQVAGRATWGSSPLFWGNNEPQRRPLPPVVVTEKGESLDEWCCRLNPNDSLHRANAMHIISHLVQRVGELHKLGLVHRDLKPGNIILLPSRNEWTIIDFGSAATIGTAVQLSMSLAYAAPETVQAFCSCQEVVVADAAVDVWALGVISYELLSRTRLFATAPRDVVEQTLAGTLALPWEGAAAHTGSLRSLGFMGEMVLRMLARDPKARPSLQQVEAAWDRVWLPDAPAGAAPPFSGSDAHTIGSLHAESVARAASATGASLSSH